MKDEPDSSSKPNQPPAASLPIFDGVKGIDDARDVQVREKTALDKLLELSEVFTASPPERLGDIDHSNYPSKQLWFCAKNYSNRIFSTLIKELKETSLTEQDIKEFVLATSNIEMPSIDHRVALGIYSGCLLTLLAERNKREGKETKFHINGHGNRFDYLFIGVNGLDEIIVQRFSGDDILNNIYGVKRIIGIGIKGDSPLCYCDGSDKTESQIVGIGIEGSHTFYHTSSVNQVIGLGLSGKSLFTGVGFYGEVNELFAVGVYDNGDESLANLGAKQITILGMNMENLFSHSCGFEEGVEKFICLKDVPPSIARRVYSIVYGGDGRQYTQHPDYLKPEQLAAQFDGKTHYEITSIVDRLSKLKGIIEWRLR